MEIILRSADRSPILQVSGELSSMEIPDVRAHFPAVPELVSGELSSMEI